METLLVISDEPALAEALADALPAMHVRGVRATELSKHLNGEVRLIVAERISLEEDSVKNMVFSGSVVPHLLVTRPLRLRELLYTIAEMLQAQTPAASDAVALPGGAVFSPRERLMIGKDASTRVTLTEKEAELFTILHKAEKTIINKEQLLKSVWGYGDEVDTHTLETHIYRLRSKLKQINPDYDIVSSEEGGYSIEMN